MKPHTMRTFPHLLACLIVPLLVAGCGAVNSPTDAPPDLILSGGHIVTLDPEQPRAQALAIRGERIVAVGGDAAIAALAGPDTQRIDLGGRTVVPGINDAHVHFSTWQSTGTVLRLPPMGPSSHALEAALRAQPVEGDDWIVGTIGGDIFLDPSWDRARLDALHPTRPVRLGVFSGHGDIFNTAAQRALDIDPSVPVPGGWYGQDSTGRFDGRVYEYAGWVLLFREPQAPDDAMADRLRTYSDAALKEGITSIQAMNWAPPDWFASVWRNSGAPLRLRLIRFEPPVVPGDPVPGADLPRHFPETPRIEVSGTKWIMDGTPVEQAAPLRAPYLDGSNGRLNFDRAETERILSEILARDDQVLLHVGGDATAEAVLEVMEAMGSAEDWRPRRLRFEHGDGLAPDLLPRAANLGVVVVQNPSHYELPDDHPITALIRGHRMGPLSDLLDAGVPLALGSDGPRNPWLNIMMAVRWAARPDQAITREQALRAYTEGSAFAEFAEHEKGRLQPGYLADLAVLSQNVLDEAAVPTEQLPATQSLLTVIGGEVAWRDPAF